ncbi:SRS domain-containing protein [Neospora caninum Liverpool]|uniref:SRS domain-containing protein n=1 Tax=Neospora caninum (strain Liverpool) TaxID=572307 RepID=F0VCW2_NEOCL|nr:SRS domain-containing protein [Neospora caninum Liverpool]CBZ51477.1 SRS domain-containing protein [Neospora caninum Liverpool]CEL65427.1 TPA: SRS domain-containing protein [Neospora caninum Liverpool]|eukprot:XP_003881510.1 SRS domain-containing protein [Neospora caninum Liverpool]
MARTQRMPRLGGGFRSSASKLMGICLGGVVIFCSGHATADNFLEGIHNRGLQDARGAGTMSGPTFKDGVATCTLSGENQAKGEQTTATALTLSTENLTARLDCSGAKNVAVPQGLQTVCKPKQTSASLQAHIDAEKCKFGTANASEGTEVPLDELLGASKKLAWANESRSRTLGTGETWTLTLTEDDLPLKDTPFFVGCKQSNENERDLPGSCKVPVHVEARPSSETNNVVTCAYGQNSNTHALEVELTAEKNAVTIECGSVGSPLPENPTIHYCAPDDGNLDSCSAKKYVDALPMFEENWVKQDGEKSSVTLTIPESGFPVEDQKLRLGCVPKADSTRVASGGQADTAFGETASSCNVMVTVRASNAASSAVSTLQAAAVASGAVAVAGLLAGSL